MIRLLTLLLAASCLTAVGQDYIEKPEMAAGPLTCQERTAGRPPFQFTYLSCKFSDPFEPCDNCAVTFSNTDQVEELCSDLLEALDYIKSGNTAEGTWLPSGVDIEVKAPWVGYIILWDGWHYIRFEPNEDAVREVVDGLRTAAASIWP